MALAGTHSFNILINIKSKKLVQNSILLKMYCVFKEISLLCPYITNNQM